MLPINSKLYLRLLHTATVRDDINPRRTLITRNRFAYYEMAVPRLLEARHAE